MHRVKICLLVLATACSSCSTLQLTSSESESTAPIELLTVDCLLSASVDQQRKHKTQKADRTSGTDCTTRGGQYIAYDDADYKSAIRVWLPQAEAGDTEAQTHVGEIDERAIGTPRSYPQAALWYKRAVEKDHQRAMTNLGNLYELGLGVGRDLNKALPPYQQAAESDRAQQGFVLSEKASIYRTKKRISNIQSQSDNRHSTREKGNSKPVYFVIEFIEPQIRFTNTVETLEIGKPQIADIIGRVTPADKIFALRVNDQNLSITDSGLFRFTHSSDALSHIEIVVIDVNGHSTRKTLELTDAPKGTNIETKINKSTGTNRGTGTPIGSNNALTKQRKPDTSGLDFGKYHALIISNQSYQSLKNLPHAAIDAAAVKKLLERRYGFTTTLVHNATQKQTLLALEKLRTRLRSMDNLLIYYIGHGFLDAKTRKTHWLAVDASLDKPDKWIPNSTVTSIINNMRAKHVLIVATTCFSDTLTQNSVAHSLPSTDALTRKKWLQAVSAVRARTLLCTDELTDELTGELTDEPTDTDRNTAPEKMSRFARTFVQVLEHTQEPMEAYRLFQRLQQSQSRSTVNNHRHSPIRYAPIHQSGHQAGEFIFAPVLVDATQTD